MAALTQGLGSSDAEGQKIAQLPDGFHLWYPHTPQNIEPLTLGKTIPGILGMPMSVRSVTRLDGKDWGVPTPYLKFP